jgi:hypothetical protein
MIPPFAVVGKTTKRPTSIVEKLFYTAILAWLSPPLVNVRLNPCYFSRTFDNVYHGNLKNEYL